MRVSDRVVTAWLDTFAMQDDNPRARWIENTIVIKRIGRNKISIEITDPHGIVERDILEADLSWGAEAKLSGLYSRVVID